MKKTYAFRAIGFVENPFREPARIEVLKATDSYLTIRPSLCEGLEGLEPGRRITVIFVFHRSSGYELLQHPRGDRRRRRRGVFSLRSPRRPNPIGITTVDLISIERNVLRVRGLDALDGSPVLDIKPA